MLFYFIVLWHIDSLSFVEYKCSPINVFMKNAIISG